MQIRGLMNELAKEMTGLFGTGMTQGIFSNIKKELNVSDDELTKEQFVELVELLFADSRLIKMLGFAGVRQRLGKWKVLAEGLASEGKKEELQKQNEELLEINRHLEELDKMKTDFLSTVSHELRTPLTSILGFSKIIKKKLDETILPQVQSDDNKVQKAIRQVQENVNIIIMESERLTNLINEVLDIAKMEAGKLELNLEPLSIAQIVERAAASTVSLFEQKGLRLNMEIDKELPVVFGDKDRLIQTVINLLSNAVKFTTEGSVTCRAMKAGHEAVVSVIDTGIGIAREDQDKVFDKFKQIGNTLTDKPKGTGLGLPICKQIIEQHGGRIWVESQPGQGSTFSFSLPLREFSVGTTESEPRLGEFRGQVGILPGGAGEKRKKILVVDDDTNIRAFLRQELESAGYIIREAENGTAALAEVKKEKPDLVLLDIIMPGISGTEVAVVLKNLPETAGIPVVFLSVVDEREEGHQIGVDRHLTKPVNTDDLLMEIQNLLFPQGAE